MNVYCIEGTLRTSTQKQVPCYSMGLTHKEVFFVHWITWDSLLDRLVLLSMSASPAWYLLDIFETWEELCPVTFMIYQWWLSVWGRLSVCSGLQLEIKAWIAGFEMCHHLDQVQYKCSALVWVLSILQRNGLFKQKQMWCWGNYHLLNQAFWWDISAESKEKQPQTVSFTPIV